jgi:hypothetical protein
MINKLIMSRKEIKKIPGEAAISTVEMWLHCFYIYAKNREIVAAK